MFAQIKKNWEELKKGSVLNPNAHPSYSAEKTAELSKRDVEFNAAEKDMRIAYGYDE